MKRGVIIGMLLVVELCAPAAAETPWYQGGTLERATLKRWQSATERDRLATMAGWTIDFMGKERAKIAGSDGLKRWAEPVVACVSKVAEITSRDYTGAAADAAKACMTKMNYPHD